MSVFQSRGDIQSSPLLTLPLSVSFASSIGIGFLYTEVKLHLFNKLYHIFYIVWSLCVYVPYYTKCIIKQDPILFENLNNFFPLIPENLN